MKINSAFEKIPALLDELSQVISALNKNKMKKVTPRSAGCELNKYEP
jgi:hypothetical protein